MFWERIFKCTLHNALYLCSITNKTFIILLSFCSQITNLNIFYKANKMKCFFKIFDLLKKWVNLKEIFISWILMNFVQGGFAPKLNGSVAIKKNYLLLDEEVVYNVLACVEVLLGFPGQLLVSFKLDLVPGLLINHTHTLNSYLFISGLFIF